MAAKAPINLDDLLATLLNCFPSLNLLEQRLSLELYRLLSEGRPVSRANLAQRLGIPVEVVNATLGRWPGVFSDSQERLVGYWGLAIPSAYGGPHRFRTNGRTLSIWCAWDSLFLPQLLGQTAEIESTSPSGDTIALEVTPERVARVTPVGAHMSFLKPDCAGVQKDVVSTFCHYIHFFPSRQSGENWAAQHPGSFILSMDEAILLAHRKNEEQYRDILTGQVT